MKLGALVTVIALAASCGGGDDGGADSTDVSMIDAAIDAAAGSDAAIDGASTKVCDGSPYEPCTMDSDCKVGQVGACRAINMLGGKFCTQTCEVPCPPVNGLAVECNMMGTACRPSVAATCTPP